MVPCRFARHANRSEPDPGVMPVPVLLLPALPDRPKLRPKERMDMPPTLESRHLYPPRPSTSPAP